MDVSKLPKLSNTQEQVRRDHASGEPTSPVPASPADSSVVPYAARGAATAGTGAEVWLSLVIGLIFILIGRNFLAYCLAKLTGRPFHTGVNWVSGPQAGQEVAYPDLEGFTMLNDAAMTLFGLTLLLEAAVIAVVGTRFRQKRWLVLLAFVAALAATAFNLYVVVRLFAANVTPLASLLAAGFGGYIAAYQWRLLQTIPSPSPASGDSRA